MIHRSFVLPIAFAFISLAACSMDHSGGTPPVAPSNLTAALLTGGAHLTWKDNSTDELHFMVMRKEMGGSANFAEVATPTFNATTYHDAPLTAGKTYLYKVVAMSEGGESEASNEAMVSIP